jgi:apolipoprotein N-acyltransferase
MKQHTIKKYVLQCKEHQVGNQEVKFQTWLWAFFFFFFLLCWVGVHCGIYKSSDNISNISYLNSHPPSFSFILPLPFYLPHFWNSFKRYHFSIYIHVYTVFAPYSPSTPFLHLLPPLLVPTP